MTGTNTWADTTSSSEMISNGKTIPKGFSATTRYRLKVVATAGTKSFVLHVDFLKFFTSSIKLKLIKIKLDIMWLKLDTMCQKLDTMWTKFAQKSTINSIMISTLVLILSNIWILKFKVLENDIRTIIFNIPIYKTSFNVFLIRFSTV